MSVALSCRRNISNNNFDIVRLVLAIVVVLSHVRDLNNISSPFFSFFSGDFAVECFFVISGYLIIRSFKNNHSLRKYIVSRGMRILPMYYISVLTFFTILFFTSHLSFSDYLNNGGGRYLFFNFIFLNFVQPWLPGVFVHNPHISAVNGALWTIKVEVLFYVFVPFFVLFVSRIQKYALYIFFLFIISSIFFKWLVSSYYEVLHIPQQLENQLPSVLSYFLLGGVVNYIELSKISRFFTFSLFSICSLYLLANFEVNCNLIFRPFAIAGFILPLCLQRIFLINVPESIGDLSYGIYVTHFPLIQLLISLGLYNELWIGLGVTCLILFIVSFLSWHFIEKPALRYAKSVGIKKVAG